MENLIYWNGVAIGIESGSMIQFFPSAPKEAITELQPLSPQRNGEAVQGLRGWVEVSKRLRLCQDTAQQANSDYQHATKICK